jgi:hypothetical protein
VGPAGTGRPPETISAIGSSRQLGPGLMQRRAVLFNDQIVFAVHNEARLQ